MAWSNDIATPGRRYSVGLKGAIAMKALLKGRDPLLEVAMEGLRSHLHSLEADERERYMLRFTIAKIRGIAERTIAQVHASYRSGRDMEGAGALAEGCRGLSVPTICAFSRYWEEGGEPSGMEFRDVSSFMIILKERGRAFSRIRQEVDRRLERKLPAGYLENGYIEGYTRKYWEARENDPEFLLLDIALQRISIWSCSD